MITREKIQSLTSLYREAVHTYTRMIMNNVEKTGISRSQHKTLQYINQNCGCSQKDIAMAQQISSAAAAVNLQRMERDGLIQREMDKIDNRRNVLTLTERGKTLATDSIKLFDAFEELSLKGFTDREVENLQKLMEKLLRNMQKVEANPGMVLKYIEEKEKKEAEEQ